MTTPELIPVTREQHQRVGARHMSATALAYLEHGLSVDVIYVDADGGGETTGGFRVIDSLDAGRIGLVGQAIQMEWFTEQLGQTEAVRRTLNNWQETVEFVIQEEDTTGEEGVLSGGSLLVSAPWAIAFVAVNRDLISELAALLLASGGRLQPAEFLPLVEGRIRGASVDENIEAFRLLEPHKEQLREIETLVKEWRQLDNR